MMKVLLKLLKITGILLVVGVGVFFAGPRAPEAILDPVIHPMTMQGLTTHLDEELQVPNLKADNEAMVFWVDSPGVQTAYSLVYLHGFSASRGEGDPIHLEFARRYSMNAYLARLDQHGVFEKDALLDLTPESLLQSAKRAIGVGKLIGKKVIVMSCSTGSTLALYLAAENPEWIDALICYSPNIDTYNQTTHLVDGPWGLQILRLAEKGKYHSWSASEEEQQFWTTSYRNEAIIDLRQLMDMTMLPSTFRKIKQPILVLYYYQNDEEQDKVVSIPAMKKMFEQISTPESDKRMAPVPMAGHHVIASRFKSKDLETVRKFTFDFAEETLSLKMADGL